MFRPRTLKDYARQITSTPTIVFFFLFLFFYVFRPRTLRDYARQITSTPTIVFSFFLFLFFYVFRSLKDYARQMTSTPTIVFFFSFFLFFYVFRPRTLMRLRPSNHFDAFLSRRLSFSTPSFLVASLSRRLPYSASLSRCLSTPTLAFFFPFSFFFMCFDRGRFKITPIK